MVPDLKDRAGRMRPWSATDHLEVLVTNSGAIFRANRAKAIYEAPKVANYEAPKVAKEEFERGKPWQSYIETTLNVQRRMAEHYFAKAEGWSGLLEGHDRWMRDYNGQEHHAHRHRKQDGRHRGSSPGSKRHATGKRT